MGFAGVVAGLGVDPLRPLSISRVMVADQPLDRPLPTFLSSLTARLSGMLILIIRRSPALCLAMDYAFINY